MQLFFVSFLFFAILDARGKNTLNGEFVPRVFWDVSSGC